jgi:hypothetical protein
LIIISGPRELRAKLVQQRGHRCIGLYSDFCRYSGSDSDSCGTDYSSLIRSDDTPMRHASELVYLLRITEESMPAGADGYIIVDRTPINVSSCAFVLLFCTQKSRIEEQEIRNERSAPIHPSHHDSAAPWLIDDGLRNLNMDRS